MSFHRLNYKNFANMGRSERFNQEFWGRFPSGACRHCGNDGTFIISCNECDPPLPRDPTVHIDIALPDEVVE
jgi:hypothetical protein